MLAALGFLVSIAYWPGIMGAATSPRWIVLGTIGVGILACDRSIIRVTAAHLAGAAFVIWGLATFLWSASPDDTIAAGWKLLLLAVAFCLGSMSRNMRAVYIAMATGLLPSGLIAIAQFNGWEGLAQWASPSGLFVNCNFYAEICALVAVALVSERLWYWLPAVAPGLLLTGARGALLGFAIPLVMICWRRSRAVTCGVVLMVAVVIVLLSQHRSLETVSHRLLYWKATAEHITPIGAGLGSFFVAGPHPQGLLWEQPHNEFLGLAFETGWVGLALFGGFAAAMMGAFDVQSRAGAPQRHLLVYPVLSRSERSAGLIIIAILMESCFEFPFHEPATAFLGCCAAGHVAGGLRWSVGEAWDRRMAVRAGRDRALAGYRIPAAAKRQTDVSV